MRPGGRPASERRPHELRSAGLVSETVPGHRRPAPQLEDGCPILSSRATRSGVEGPAFFRSFGVGLGRRIGHSLARHRRRPQHRRPAARSARSPSGPKQITVTQSRREMRPRLRPEGDSISKPSISMLGSRRNRRRVPEPGSPNERRFCAVGVVEGRDMNRGVCCASPNLQSLPA